MNDILEISKAVCFCLKWFIYIVAGIFIFLGVTQLVECFGVDAANKFAGMFTPLIVAVVTIYLSNRQHNIADAQRAIAVQQAKTASNKLRLDLFDKRFNVYQNIIEIKAGIDDIVSHIENSLRIKKAIRDTTKYIFTHPDKKLDEKKLHSQENVKILEANLGKVEFLFNESLRENCTEIIKYCNLFLLSIEFQYEDEIFSFYDDPDSLTIYIPKLNEIYKEIRKDIKPYMDLSTIQ